MNDKDLKRKRAEIEALTRAAETSIVSSGKNQPVATKPPRKNAAKRGVAKLILALAALAIAAPLVGLIGLAISGSVALAAAGLTASLYIYLYFAAIGLGLMIGVGLVLWAVKTLLTS